MAMKTMIQGVLDHGALPALQRMATFTAQRHKVLTNNIANLSTPYFKPGDLNPELFQQQLGQAIDQRRRSRRPLDGDLRLTPTRQISERDGRMSFDTAQANEGILYHDQNNRDLERTMQALAENTLAHNATIDFLKGQFDLLRSAIRERP
ncbi:flagellar basal body rod protein FlgB [Mucisphaera sp.]|uniref:flagellar basal body rod protein FlgB n=1 Tax=Mucisphaera sp. TaxID=2913024 RepID=UPI003D10DFAF